MGCEANIVATINTVISLLSFFLSSPGLTFLGLLLHIVGGGLNTKKYEKITFHPDSTFLGFNTI
jgi:hypothetical protein